MGFGDMLVSSFGKSIANILGVIFTPNIQKTFIQPKFIEICTKITFLSNRLGCKKNIDITNLLLQSINYVDPLYSRAHSAVWFNTF